jgi:hypothetical protein
MTSLTTPRRHTMQYLMEPELAHERQADLLREAARWRLVKRARHSTRRPLLRRGDADEES